MISQQSSLSAVSLLLLIGFSFLHLSSPNPLDSPGDINSSHRPASPGLVESGDGERKDEERQSVRKGNVEEEEENDDELFKDVDPKTLAAVLVEALKSREGGDTTATRGKVKKDEASEGTNQDRNGRQELELLMAAQGEQQDKEEAEKRRIAQEEEEKMTEKVTSHTTSQTVQVQNKQWWDKADRTTGKGPDGTSQQAPEQGSNEQEEQLNPEELKSLETVMKEFPRLHTFTKREKELEQKQRASRHYSSYNDILPLNKGSDLAMSKKKLKWQEETQKGMSFPTFTGGNFMNDFEEGNFVGGNAAQSEPPPEQATEADDSREKEEEGEEEEEEEEMLSPEEEEAQAKAEQEELRRQAAEAQRAKMEEEKLADIASDMLLRYMVKQNHGNKKYSLSLSNGAEDKRSNEDQEVTEEEDIDPQTIDKLIEISTKLHLPADDVVDIISDVEKKKKKDVTPEMTSRWQQPVMPLSTSSLVSDLSVSKANQKGYSVSKQLSSPVNPLKTWFQRKMPPSSQDLWAKPANPNSNFWSKTQKTLSMDQDFWPKSPMSGYPAYPFTYRPYYQRKPYPGYYPILFPPPTRLKSRYYAPKPAFNGFVGNAVDNAYYFPPRRQYNSWIQPRLRKPPMALQQRPYYTNYPLPLYTRTFVPMPMPMPRPLPKPHSPVRVPPQKGQFYFSPSEPERMDDSMVVKQQDRSNIHGNLEKYIEQMLQKQAHISD